MTFDHFLGASCLNKQKSLKTRHIVNNYKTKVWSFGLEKNDPEKSWSFCFNVRTSVERIGFCPELLLWSSELGVSICVEPLTNFKQKCGASNWNLKSRGASDLTCLAYREFTWFIAREQSAACSKKPWSFRLKVLELRVLCSLSQKLNDFGLFKWKAPRLGAP